MGLFRHWSRISQNVSIACLVFYLFLLVQQMGKAELELDFNCDPVLLETMISLTLKCHESRHIHHQDCSDVLYQMN